MRTDTEILDYLQAHASPSPRHTFRDRPLAYDVVIGDFTFMMPATQPVDIRQVLNDAIDRRMCGEVRDALGV